MIITICFVLYATLKLWREREKGIDGKVKSIDLA